MIWEAKEICHKYVVLIFLKEESAFLIFLLRDQPLPVSVQNVKFLWRGSVSCSPFKMGENKNILPVTEDERSSHP